MNIKKTYLCKEIIDFVVDKNIPADYRPEAGDVAVFEIIKIGKHRTAQSESRRNMTIIPGDFMMGTFGNRYATAQFEGYVPEDLNRELHILGAGGVIGVIKSMHYDFIDIGPTIIKTVGLVKDSNGKLFNTKTEKQSQMLSFSGASASKTKVILSLGSSMDSGKSTTASYLVNGIKRAGKKVGFIKLTGTAYTKDADLNTDLGADIVSDFSDFGFPSTYLCNENEMLDLYESLIDKVNTVNPDYVVMEIADGLYQRETMMLCKNKKLMSSVHAVIFSAGDSLSAIHGINLLIQSDIKPFALCGLFTASPLLIEEVKINKDFDIPVVNIEELSNNAISLLKHNFIQNN
jgi:hypothetical protein